MDELKIHTLIQARYRIFDSSGKLPFTIDFALCRHSPQDTDPRALVLDISGSVLDVPYALANGLLISHGINTLQRDKQKLKQSDFGNKVGEKRYITLSSLVDRTEHYKKCFTEFEYHVDADSELALLLEPGKAYSIKLASRDLGVKWYTYVDDPLLPLDEKLLSRPCETSRLVNSKPSAGNAAFKMVESLPWPPEISTRLCFKPATETTPSCIEICITNLGLQSLSIQASDQQRFLGPRDFFGREMIQERSHRTLEVEHPRLSFAFSVTKASTKEAVPCKAIRAGCKGLTSGNVDLRPRSKDLLTLESGQPLLRRVDIGALISGLDDGTYTIRLREKNMWWCMGSKEDICDMNDDGGRVRKELFDKDIPPLVLNTSDTVKVEVTNRQLA